MKKYLVILFLLTLSKVSFGQKILVADTIRMELKGLANQPYLHKLIKTNMNDGWKVISAERVVDNGKEGYVWKMEKVVFSRRKENK